MDNPTKQGKVKVGYKKPPIDKRFGQPNGNPRHNGAWKKEDTLRFKWEKMLTMDEAELFAVLNDPKASKVERTTAEVLLDADMKSSDKLSMLTQLANQVYGLPKQINENRNIELKPILPMEDKR